MPAPPWMKFYPDAYCNDTMTLTMDEQGAYMRVLCQMWLHGGKIRNDDRVIARMLHIHVNKWRKVKPSVMEYLTEHSPGFLTQKRLWKEYQNSSGTPKVTPNNTPQDTYGNSPANTPADTSHNTLWDTHQNTPHDNQQNTLPNTPHHQGNKNQSNQQNTLAPTAPADWPPEGGVVRCLARALEDSRSRSKDKTTFRPLEDGNGANGGQVSTAEEAERFVGSVIDAFAKYNLQPPLDYDVVKGWIDNGCDPLEHILPGVIATLANIDGAKDPPKSWRYFVHEVYARRKEGNHHG